MATFTYEPSRILCELEITYVGAANQTLGLENLTVSGSLKGAVVRDQFGFLNSRAVSSSDVNLTTIQFLPRSLPRLGSEYNVRITYEVDTRFSQPRTDHLHLDFHKEVSLLVVRVELMNGFSYYGSEITPSEIRNDFGTMTLRWVGTHSTLFLNNLTLGFVQPHYLEEFTIVPDSTKVGPTQRLVVVNVTNKGNSTLKFALTENRTFFDCLNNTQFSLAGGESREVFLLFNASLGSVDDVAVFTKVWFWNQTQVTHEIRFTVVARSWWEALVGPALLLLGLFLLVLVLAVTTHRGWLQQWTSSFRVDHSASLEEPVSDPQENPRPDLDGESPLLHEGPTRAPERQKKLQELQSLMKPKEFKVLEFLVKNPFEHSQQEIANGLNISKSTMSRLLTRLEQRQLIDRRQGGMSNLVTLSERARRILFLTSEEGM